MRVAKKPDSWRVAGTQLLCLAGERKNPLTPPASPACTSVTVGFPILSILCPVFAATPFASSSELDLFLPELQIWAHHRAFVLAMILARTLSLGYTWLPNTLSLCLNVGVTFQSWLVNPTCSSQFTSAFFCSTYHQTTQCHPGVPHGACGM